MTTFSFEPTTVPVLIEPEPEPRMSDAVGGRSQPPASGASVRLDDPRPEQPPPAAKPGAPVDAIRSVELPELRIGPSVEGSQDEGGLRVPREAPAEELVRIRDEARSEGYTEGLAEGRRLESERLASAFDVVRGLTRSIESAAAAREQEVRARVTVLATAIATHLLEREIRTAPEVMSELVRRAIAEFPVRDTLRVHLNPSDLALLSAGGGEDGARALLTGGQAVHWIPDPNLRSGGCLVEGRERIVDARITTIVDRICRALIDG